ncbi:hypothetical protein [Asanoa iriomotensis]|uniref:hypothetical protein n=1 Tax=Asanoa iriomotensis TaxID=234613 RepID=UPI001EF32541|nr:hypothetical protein [Asanoa iriomotensis]
MVPGDPPVPITVWPVPAPHPGETISHPMGVRLVHNLTHTSDLILDLTVGPQLTRAVIASRRRRHPGPTDAAGWCPEPAALVVAVWPPPPAAGPPSEFFSRCRAHLRAGGCVAVLLPHGDPTQPVDVVIAAKEAGLSYLQHIVATHRAPVAGSRAELNIHTDVLILTRTRSGGDQNG